MTTSRKPKDAYAVLGVARDASTDTIKSAYRKLAREMHPDADRGNPWAEDEFKTLSSAYDILFDPAKRERYDRGEIDLHGAKQARRRRPKSEAGSHGPGAGTSGGGRSARDKARSFFGQRGAKGRKGLDIDGADVNYSLTIDFLEAARGADKHVSMTNGKRLKVTIPPGTEDGRILRLKGQGMAGMGAGKDGDAMIEIAIEAHDTFARDRADVHVEVPVTLPEAVLGAKIEAPTIDGGVNVAVPAGSNTGSKLRLKGKGLPTGAKGDGPRGDQYVTLRVVLPPKPDGDLKAFLETWAPNHPYTVRKPSGA